MFSIEEIMRNVPHRYPFLLIDRVKEFTANESVVTLKNVSINEAQFQGHFPNRPIFPGVYIIENQAQSACFLLAKSAGGIDDDTVYYLGRVGKMAFKRPVVPGDQLITSIRIEKKMGNNAMVTTESRVDGELAAKGEMMFAASKASD
jgi:3-hydroxyacyl-[acyl-carrier-protein] dehydratase